MKYIRIFLIAFYSTVVVFMAGVMFAIIFGRA